jgi:hypothetical protein
VSDTDETKVAEEPVAAAPDAGAPAPVLGFRVRISRRGAIVIGIVVLVIAALVLPVFFTLQPSYYERYPALRVRIENWRKSTHSLMTCADCHVDPGIGGFVTFAAKSIPDFYSQLIVGPNSTNLLSVPSTAACEKCHTTYRQVSPSGDLLIPHRAHVVVLGIKCAVCHKNLVHSPNPQGFNTPVMQTCMTCHDGKQATNECVKCHTQKEVPASHHQADWLQVHGAQSATVDCGKCHGYAPDYCRTTCHLQLPPSHVGNWKQLHQFAVAQQGTKGCYFCHDQQTFCGKCH